MEKWNIRKNKMLPVIFALAWPTYAGAVSADSSAVY